MPEHALEGVRVALVRIDLEIVVGRTGSAVLAGNHRSGNDSSPAYLLRGEYVFSPGAVADFSSERRLGVQEYLGKLLGIGGQAGRVQLARQSQNLPMVAGPGRPEQK